MVFKNPSQYGSYFTNYFFFIEVFSKHSTWGMLMNISVFLNIIEVPSFTHPWNLTDYLGFYFLRLVCFLTSFFESSFKALFFRTFLYLLKLGSLFCCTHCSYRVINVLSIQGDDWAKAFSQNLPGTSQKLHY